MTVLRTVSKAVGAGIGAAIGAYYVANQVGGVTAEEWGGVVGALLFTAVVTYFAPKNAEAA